MATTPSPEYGRSALADPLTDHPRPDASMPRDTRFFGHPAGLSTLFFTEMWERFSYYGMRALLILFMTAPLATGGLAFPTEKAGLIYGTYTAMVYLMALPGGWLADKILGQRKAVFWGGVLIMFGHISLAISGMATFYAGLLLVVLGTGLLKPNISAMVGQIYPDDDERRDAGFSLFYMGINIGAMVAPLVCGFLAQSESWRSTLAGWGMDPRSSWHWGFGAAAVGMFLGLVQYTLGGRRLGEAGLRPAPAKDAHEMAARKRTMTIGALVVLGLVGLVVALGAAGIVELTAETIGRGFGWMLGLVVVGFFAWLFMGGDWTPQERRRLITIFVLFMGASVFWSVFEQAGSTLSLFAERNTNNSLFGWEFPASYWQSVNSAFLIIFAPIFAVLWIKLGRKNPSSPAKFAVGLFFVALGFVVLAGGASLSANGGRVGPGWLATVFLLHTIGELCLSPVGLSAMTTLAPARIVGLMMGVWFLATSVGSYIGGTVASLYETFALPTLFMAVAGYAFLAALIIALLVKPIRNMLARKA